MSLGKWLGMDQTGPTGDRTCLPMFVAYASAAAAVAVALARLVAKAVTDGV